MVISNFLVTAMFRAFKQSQQSSHGRGIQIHSMQPPFCGFCGVAEECRFNPCWTRAPFLDKTRVLWSSRLALQIFSDWAFVHRHPELNKPTIETQTKEPPCLDIIYQSKVDYCVCALIYGADVKVTPHQRQWLQHNILKQSKGNSWKSV